MNDPVTTLLHEQAARLDVRLASPADVRRAAQHHHTARRSAAVLAAAIFAIIVVLLATSSPLVDRHRTLPADPADRFPGLPPVGAPASLPGDGRLVLHINSASGDDWSVYADGRLIWQRWTAAGDPLVIPGGADAARTAYVQQRLTPQGTHLLVSRILAIGRPAGLFDRNRGFSDAALNESTRLRAPWYQVCDRKHLIYSQVLPTDITDDPKMTMAQARAIDQIDRLVADATTRLPADAWVDRTIRPYVPPRYQLSFDRSPPDPSKMPSPAQEALRYAMDVGSGSADWTITTEQARTLLAAFARSGVAVERNHAEEWEFRVPAVGDLRHTGLRIFPALPVFIPARPNSDAC